MQCMWLANGSYQCSYQFTHQNPAFRAVHISLARISMSKIWRFRRFLWSHFVSFCSFSFFCSSDFFWFSFLILSLSFLLFSFSRFFLFEGFPAGAGGPEGFRPREEGPEGFRSREGGPEGFRPRAERPEGFRSREEGPGHLLLAHGRKSKCGKGIGSLLLVPSDFLRLPAAKKRHLHAGTHLRFDSRPKKKKLQEFAKLARKPIINHHFPRKRQLSGKLSWIDLRQGSSFPNLRPPPSPFLPKLQCHLAQTSTQMNQKNEISDDKLQ